MSPNNRAISGPKIRSLSPSIRFFPIAHRVSALEDASHRLSVLSHLGAVLCALRETRKQTGVCSRDQSVTAPLEGATSERSVKLADPTAWFGELLWDIVPSFFRGRGDQSEFGKGRCFKERLEAWFPFWARVEQGWVRPEAKVLAGRGIPSIHRSVGAIR